MKTGTLKLITRYDAHENEYTVFRHNLGAIEPNEARQQLAGELFSLFIVDQHGVHPAEDPLKCVACRREVERTYPIKPKPTFQRRNT